jgi:hypothetical protein
MDFSENMPQLCADLVLARVAERFAKENDLTNTEALQRIMETKTYDLLVKPESKMCYESTESILALLKDEESGDWDAWMKI